MTLLLGSWAKLSNNTQIDWLLNSGGHDIGIVDHT